MKALLQLTCILSAVVLISALEKEVCEAPYATAYCASDAELRDFFYFYNGTGKCEIELGCRGPMNYPTEEECIKACPYGIYASRS
uniref:Putative secreted salivary protein n=1 Tax=Ixodes scapularis TaxID=6945 RepID=Q4PMP7_IXOSC|nr:putative secreted salivary protein [Ixodes scapularis]